MKSRSPKRRLLKKNHASRRKFIVIPILAILAVLGITSIAYGVIYNLNKTIPATVTVTDQIVEVTLYSDALATTPVPEDYVHNFGTVDEIGTPQNPLWFRAEEINPTSINVTAAGLPDGASIGFLVGTPMNAMPGKPCTLALWLTGVPVGTYDFSITVTGTSV